MSDENICMNIIIMNIMGIIVISTPIDPTIAPRAGATCCSPLTNACPMLKK
jgi:hypothetical protein